MRISTVRRRPPAGELLRARPVGLTYPIALGVALAQPQRGVLAPKATARSFHGAALPRPVANVKPRNLTIIIWDNGLYQITGKQPTATSGPTDIVAVARGAGIANSAWARDEAHFDALIDRRFDEGGPALIAAKIDDQPAAGPAVRDPALIRNRFMKGLGTSRGGVLDA